MCKATIEINFKYPSESEEHVLGLPWFRDAVLAHKCGSLLQVKESEISFSHKALHSFYFKGANSGEASGEEEPTNHFKRRALCEGLFVYSKPATDYTSRL